MTTRLLHVATRFNTITTIHITLPLSNYTYVRSEYIDSGYGALKYADALGYGWACLSRLGVAVAYVLSFRSSDVDSSNGGTRYVAFPVHCSLGGVCTSNAMCSTSNRTCRYASRKPRKCL